MRLIDADMLKEKVPNTNVDIFENCRNCSTLMDWQVKELIDEQPTIEAVEVKRGRWEEHILDGIMGHRPTIIVCSECNCTAFAKFNYCPNCGAKMDGEEKNNG